MEGLQLQTLDGPKWQLLYKLWKVNKSPSKVFALSAFESIRVFQQAGKATARHTQDQVTLAP